MQHFAILLHSKKHFETFHKSVMCLWRPSCVFTYIAFSPHQHIFQQNFSPRLCIWDWLPIEVATLLVWAGFSESVSSYFSCSSGRYPGSHNKHNPGSPNVALPIIQMLFAKSLHVDHVSLRKLSVRILNRKLINHTVLQIKSL